MRNWLIPTARTLSAITLLGLLGACAPDAMDNLEAKGFNRYLDSLQRDCKDFYIGHTDVHEWLQNNPSGSGGADQWLDDTSRLYYGRITPAQYRASVESALGEGGERNARSFECIFSHLPANRPHQPPEKIYDPFSKNN